MQDRYHLFKLKRSKFDRSNWVAFFKKYVTSRKDFQGLWQLIAFQMFNILLKESCLTIPYIGRIEIRVKRLKRYVKLHNTLPYWLYPKSSIVFVPAKELKEVFQNKFLGMHEIRELEDGTFDWMKKSDDNTKYQRRIDPW
jgi:hypothetical protein